MQFCLVHIESDPSPDDEVSVIVPGGPRTALMVPLAALPRLLAMMHAAAEGADPPPCEGCGVPLPGHRPA